MVIYVIVIILEKNNNINYCFDITFSGFTVLLMIKLHAVLIEDFSGC